MSAPERVGLLLPGQGSQFVGMGRDLGEAYPEARAAFEEADDALGFALSRLCREGPAEELTRTMNAQPAILVHSVAAWRVLQARRPAATLAAGHSLGEFTAYVAAGALEFADAVRLVRRRGELMYDAGTRRPGGMAAVLGLDDSVVEAACREASQRGEGTVVAANYNAPGQVVVSGDPGALRIADQLFRAAGARRVLPLNVSGAFHSPLMAEAVAELEAAIAAVAMRDPEFPVVSNVTASPVESAAAARPLLVEQLTSPVRWVASVEAMLAAGVTYFLEVGPGNVLTGLLRRVDRGVTGHAVGTAAEVHAYLSGELS